MNAKIWIGMLMFYVICQVVGNFVGGNAMVTGANVADLNNASSSSVTTSTDSAGTPAQYVSMGSSFFSTAQKIAFFDYTMFRNTDGTANEWVILRYLLICIGIYLLVDAAVVFRQLLSGG